MPTYDFKCSSCGHKFEEFLPINSGTEIQCPICGKSSMRLISAGGGLLFKGSGFYITDHRKPEYKEKAKLES